MTNESPCKTCTRVKDPYTCGNINCIPWREWFLGWWAAMQKNCSALLQNIKQEEAEQ